MTRDELLRVLVAERNNTNWWMTADPDAAEHRRILEAALADWTDPVYEMANYRPTAQQLRDNLVEDVEFMLSNGETVTLIAQRLGRSIGAIRIACDRAQRRDLARRFDREEAA